MEDQLKRMYAEVVRAAMIMYALNETKQTGFIPVEHKVPVIPGAFSGECVTFRYTKDTRTKVRSVSVSVPSLHGTHRTAGPFPVPFGKTPDVPQIVIDLLESFEKDGPSRLSRRVRELVKELLRAGVGVAEIHEEVDLALAESVMNT